MMKSVLKKTWVKVLLTIAVIIAGYFVRTELDQIYERSKTGVVTEYTDGTRVGRNLVYAGNVSEENPALQDFRVYMPETKVLLACEEDLTNDRRKDLVVIYSLNEDLEKGMRYTPVWLTVAVDDGNGGYVYTEPISAPVENNRIQFQNFDNKDETEFVLQGSKGEKIGYAIYRVMDGEVVSLFDQGMKEC